MFIPWFFIDLIFWLSLWTCLFGGRNYVSWACILSAYYSDCHSVHLIKCPWVQWTKGNLWKVSKCWINISYWRKAGGTPPGASPWGWELLPVAYMALSNQHQFLQDWTVPGGSCTPLSSFRKCPHTKGLELPLDPLVSWHTLLAIYSRAEVVNQYLLKNQNVDFIL